MKHSGNEGPGCEGKTIHACVQDYDEALSVRPGHILAHLRKGMVLQALKRPEVKLHLDACPRKQLPNTRPHVVLRNSANLERFLSHRTTCVAASLAALQEARRCWQRAEELFQPQHDLLLLLEAQSLLAGVSPPPLGAAGISLASSPSTETPAAATAEPSPAAAQAPSRPQVPFHALP